MIITVRGHDRSDTDQEYHDSATVDTDIMHDTESLAEDDLVTSYNGYPEEASDHRNNGEYKSEVVVKENVVPVDHVEEVINRVIQELSQVLYNLKDSRSEATDKYITQADLDRALQIMKLQIVTEIR